MNKLKQIWGWFFPKWKVIEVLQGDWTEQEYITDGLFENVLIKYFNQWQVIRK